MPKQATHALSPFPLPRPAVSLPTGATGACRACGRLVYNGSAHCMNRRCPRFGPIWAGDQRTKIFRNLEACKAERVRMGSFTAPGASRLPFDQSRCTHGPGVRCSGSHGCKVEAGLAVDWNAAMPKVWRELHRRAYTKTVRRFGAGRLRMLLRVYELQKRGVLHVHPVFAYETHGQRAAADYYFATVASYAPAYGFGSQHQEVTLNRMEAAAYLSSYFASGSKSKLTLTEAVKSGAMPRSIIHVSVALTQRTGITMRSLRRRRLLWVLDQIPELEWVELRGDEALQPKELRKWLRLSGLSPGEVERLILNPAD